jgi:hypothetical protein
MGVNWETLKDFADSRNISIQWIDLTDRYICVGLDGVFGLECVVLKTDPVNSAQQDFEDNYKSSGNNSPLTKVETQREFKNLRLQSITLSGTADGSGVCVVQTQVPNTGIHPGRYIDWGEAWITGTSHDDDKITEIAIVDVDNILGYGANTIIKKYTDDDSSDAGWTFPAKPAIAEVEPLGWYGYIPGGLYLRITAQCGGAIFTGRKLKVNVGWGIKDAV